MRGQVVGQVVDDELFAIKRRWSTRHTRAKDLDEVCFFRAADWTFVDFGRTRAAKTEVSTLCRDVFGLALHAYHTGVIQLVGRLDRLRDRLGDGLGDGFGYGLRDGLNKRLGDGLGGGLGDGLGDGRRRDGRREFVLEEAVFWIVCVAAIRTKLADGFKLPRRCPFCRWRR